MSAPTLAKMLAIDSSLMPRMLWSNRNASQAMRLIRVGKESSKWKAMLRTLGLLADQADTRLIASNIQMVADTAPERKRHRFGFLAEDSSAIYFNAGEERMIKVSADAIEEVPIGTDGVIQMADDLRPWPAFTEILSHVEKLRPFIGKACTMPLPGLPMSKNITARWATSKHLSADQLHWLWLQRIVFMCCSNRYSVWPLILILGEQNSGKSTGPERLLAALLGEATDLKGLPERGDALIASLTNRALAVYDNIDGFVDDRGRAGFSNTFCLVATGGEIDMRKLYSTNELVSIRVQNHVWFTSRTMPFERDDLLRRVLRFGVTAEGSEDGDKDAMIESAAQARTPILAEWLLRAQNIVKAHRQWQPRPYKLITQIGVL